MPFWQLLPLWLSARAISAFPALLVRCKLCHADRQSRLAVPFWQIAPYLVELKSLFRPFPALLVRCKLHIMQSVQVSAAVSVYLINVV